MIERIIEYSIRNRFLVIAVFLAVTVWGAYSVLKTPVDAIPDLSENQVIVFTDWMGRSPKEIEDQITYPLSVNLQGLAGVKSVRSSSEFNFSMINIIFEDGVDFYFARQRVLERLTLASTFLPPGVIPYLAPDATALGQIFWYTVEGGGLDSGRLRAIQDWYIRYQLNSVPGVAQVASVGGYPIEYQIEIDPAKLRLFNVTLGELFSAVSRSNSSVGGRVVHKGNAEYLIRGAGWLGTRPGREIVESDDVLRDIENIVIKADSEKGTPIYVANLGKVGLGPQFRRSVLEKDGNEVVGGVALMRHGENPLEVTKRIKEKIQQLQPGLPEGVRIVPFYDRTRLIEGAIHTLTEILTHEIVIAAVAILLILNHARSAFVICLTLPLAVLVSFIMMRHFGIASNIMSLSGIAISIGILVDQAIVMVENATHHLKEKFGEGRVHGDTREIVIRACRTVGRPIFFSVVIILISFIPVFALTGQEGKTFHPLAFTKSFAMVGVAIISVTLVPALIPTFVRGRLRAEEENWIVRSLIRIYKPVLTWALPRRNLVMWLFAVLLILGAGIFPLDALFGMEWSTAFLVVFTAVTVPTVALIHGLHRQIAAFVTLTVLAVWVFGFPKIGKEYMPPLDEGSILDMPVTVPRASVVQTADDLKVRDGVLRSFPEVEQIVGKGGRAETPTDPSPLDMVESVINLRPKEFWPKRKMRYEDAERQLAEVLQQLHDAGLVRQLDGADRKALLNDAAMAAVTRFDEAMRKFVLLRHREFEAALRPQLTRAFVAELVAFWSDGGHLMQPATAGAIDAATERLSGRFGPMLAAGPAQEDVNRFVQFAVEHFAAAGFVRAAPEILALRRNAVVEALVGAGEVLGVERETLFTKMLMHMRRLRESRWQQRVRELDYELFDRAVSGFNWFCLEEIRAAALKRGLWTGESGPTDSVSPASEQLKRLRAPLDEPLARDLFLWKKSKSDIIKEMDTAMQMPGWANIWTQPIINRIDMLATGVRTMIGVKVFGTDLNEIQKVSDEVASVLREIPGAADVFPDQNVGKGYIEIHVDRLKAARYGVNLGDVQDVIEVALGGRPITMTVEGRERHPVRLRYARSYREDEQSIRELLINASGAGMAAGGMGSGSMSPSPGGAMGGPTPATGSSRPLQIPLAMVAEVRVVEGPSMIKSENGMLRSYVQLNVRDRDIVGFVEEAQRAVAQRVKLPPRMHLEWSGQFEHKIRSDRTMRLVFPAVMILIFLILYLTYNDVMDAGLMMMAVPEALVGGVFFLWLMGFNYSVAVQVGFIACFGMATETGIIMLVYLREAIEKRGGLENIRSLEELQQTVLEGAVHRLRPKLLTEGVAIVALAPMLWASGVGHEVISAMAAPVLGGLLIADEVVDIFIPVRFYWIRRKRWLQLHGGDPADSSPENGPDVPQSPPM